MPSSFLKGRRPNERWLRVRPDNHIPTLNQNEVAMNPWDRLEHEGETAVAFAHFCRYRDAGPTRQLRDTYRQAVGKPQARQASGQWLKWYTRFRWRQRAELWDAHREQLKQDTERQE